MPRPGVSISRESHDGSGSHPGAPSRHVRWIGDGLETLSGHSGSDTPLPVKGLAALAFFLVFTVLIATGMVLGVHGNSKGWWIMVASLVAYLGFFIKKGCLTQAH